MSHKYQSPHFENMQQRRKFIYVNAFLQDASQKEQNTILSKIYSSAQNYDILHDRFYMTRESFYLDACTNACMYTIMYAQTDGQP